MKLKAKDIERLRLAHGLLMEVRAFLLVTEKAQRKLRRLPIAKEIGGRRTPQNSARRAMIIVGRLLDKAAWRQ